MTAGTVKVAVMPKRCTCPGGSGDDLGAELACGRGEISGRDPLRSTGDAEVNDDNTGTLLALWPSHLVIGQAFLD